MSEFIEPNTEFSKEVAKRAGNTFNLCFQCGTCTGSCASGYFTAFRTRKVVRMAQLGLPTVLESDDLWACTTCYTCYERCPRGVDIPEIIFAIRNMAVEKGYMGEAHRKTAGFLLKTGHMVPINDEIKKTRQHLGLEEVPDTTLANPKALSSVQRLMMAMHFDELIGTKEE